MVVTLPKTKKKKTIKTHCGPTYTSGLMLQRTGADRLVIFWGAAEEAPPPLRHGHGWTVPLHSEMRPHTSDQPPCSRTSPSTPQHPTPDQLLLLF